jgi:hypothetical protein
VYKFQNLYVNKGIWEKKWRVNYLTFSYNAIKLQNNDIISPHFAYKHQGIVTHATSNINFKPDLDQRIVTSLPDLTKIGSGKPGTIFSFNAEKLTSSRSRTVLVPEFELNMLYMGNLDWFKVPLIQQDYFNERRDEIQSIFHETIKIKPHQDDMIYRELIIGHYFPVIQLLSETEIQEVLISAFKT